MRLDRVEIFIHIPLRSKKAGRYAKMLHFDSSLLNVTSDSRVSRAPPHHTLPAFLNLNGSIKNLSINNLRGVI